MIPSRLDVLGEVAKDPETWYPYGMLADYHINIWKNTAKFIPDHWYWTTKAGGKVYDMQIYALNKALTGEQSIDQVVDNITRQTLDLTSKFDKVTPISEEK